MKNIEDDLDDLIRAGVIDPLLRDAAKTFLKTKYEGYETRYDTLVEYFDRAVQKGVDARIRCLDNTKHVAYILHHRKGYYDVDIVGVYRDYNDARNEEMKINEPHSTWIDEMDIL